MSNAALRQGIQSVNVITRATNIQGAKTAEGIQPSGRHEVNVLSNQNVTLP
jgi:hypothetical protein